jgi:hypothetical protein
MASAALAAMALSALSVVVGISAVDVLQRKDVNLRAAFPVKIHTHREAVLWPLAEQDTDQDARHRTH